MSASSVITGAFRMCMEKPMQMLCLVGRKAEVFGKAEIFSDLYVRLIIDSAEAVADYNKAPVWLKKLLNAYADGINYYLHKHPEVKPLLLTRFKPWYPLLWTDGSIGAISTGDISEMDLWRNKCNNFCYTKTI